MQKTLIIKAGIVNNPALTGKEKIELEMYYPGKNPLEAIGLYEFIKVQFGKLPASFMALRIDYSEKEILIKINVKKRKYFFYPNVIFDRLKEREMGLLEKEKFKVTSERNLINSFEKIGVYESLKFKGKDNSNIVSACERLKEKEIGKATKLILSIKKDK